MNTSDILQDVVREIRRGAQEYAAILEPASRTSVRARVLSLLERVDFLPGPVKTVRVSPEELTRDGLLRGALHLHVDLVFRSSLSSEELLFTAARGWVYAAYHESLEGFPVGVVLALPVSKMIRKRSELFADKGPTPAETKSVVIYSVATNPPKLGAGQALIEAVRDNATTMASSPSLVAFSPLTGMRARIIRAVDDAAVWSEIASRLEAVDPAVLRPQLLELLTLANLPESVPEPAASWLLAEGRLFAQSDAYRAGSFHRSMGARLVGLSECGDPSDGESMWMRAYYEYETDGSK